MMEGGSVYPSRHEFCDLLSPLWLFFLFPFLVQLDYNFQTAWKTVRLLSYVCY